MHALHNMISSGLTAKNMAKTTMLCMFASFRFLVISKKLANMHNMTHFGEFLPVVQAFLCYALPCITSANNA